MSIDHYSKQKTWTVERPGNMGRNKYLMYVDNNKEYTQKGYGMHFSFFTFCKFFTVPLHFQFASYTYVKVATFN